MLEHHSPLVQRLSLFVWHGEGPRDVHGPLKRLLRILPPLVPRHHHTPEQNPGLDDVRIRPSFRDRHCIIDKLLCTLDIANRKECVCQRDALEGKDMRTLLAAFARIGQESQFFDRTIGLSPQDVQICLIDFSQLDPLPVVDRLGDWRQLIE